MTERLFRKQLFPVGTFPGFDLTDHRLSEMVQKFETRSADIPPPVYFSDVQGQGEDNNLTPDRQLGMLTGIEHDPTLGLWGYFHLNTQGADFVTTYGNVGVKARLNNNNVILNVIITHLPTFTGMEPWEDLTDLLSAEEDPELSFEEVETFDFAEPQLNTEGVTPMSNNIDGAVLLRLEQFVERSLGVSCTGQSQSTTIDLAMQAAVGRDREYAEALTGQEIISPQVATQDEMRSWLDNNC